MRDSKLDSIKAYIRQERDYHLLGKSPELGFDFCDKGTQNPFPRLFYPHRKSKIERLHNRTSSDTHKIAESLRSVKYEGKHIRIPIRGTRNNTLGIMFRQNLKPVLVDLRLLEIQLFGSSLHLLPILLDKSTALALENSYDFFYISRIFRLRIGSDTGSHAPPNIIIKAGAQFPLKDSIGVNLVAAGAKLVSRVEKLHQALGMGRTAIRAEITRPVLLYPTGDKDPREWL